MLILKQVLFNLRETERPDVCRSSLDRKAPQKQCDQNILRKQTESWTMKVLLPSRSRKQLTSPPATWGAAEQLQKQSESTRTLFLFTGQINLDLLLQSSVSWKSHKSLPVCIWNNIKEQNPELCTDQRSLKISPLWMRKMITWVNLPLLLWYNRSKQNCG